MLRSYNNYHGSPVDDPCLEKLKYFLLTLVELPLIALISNNQPTKAFVADNVTTATSYTSDISPAGARYAIRVNSPT